MPLAARASNVLDLLELDDIGRRPVVFICHSLGGLVVKQLLRNAGDSGNAAWKAIATQTKAIVFLSTPHSGADLASWIKYIGGLLRTTVSVKELEAHDPHLRNLNQWYRNHVVDFDIKTVVYCETRPVAGILVVNETTADPGIVGVVPIPMPEDHVSICKPASKDSQIYRRVMRLVKDIVTQSRPPAPQPSTEQGVASDFGQVKIDLCRRLGADWQLLADYFNIEHAERARFDKGWEPQRVWEWLESRGRLTELAEGLRYIHRNDLADLLDRPR
jgi:pimeloyl-ACP methyl ester carboxylesterase